ncbi:Methylesterase 3 [Platanthera zijinensis]|uniref:Methylesterase 3 n=1 Tax=Platanthera zijinensis TaxID=2320716 RepID=A0AAP0B8K4_9ASPA
MTTIGDGASHEDDDEPSSPPSDDSSPLDDDDATSQDWTLAKMMVRPTSFFKEDLSKRAAFSEERYGSMDKVFMLYGEDASLTLDYQRWMVKNSPVKELMEINGPDHMPLLSKPQELCQCIATIANSCIR